MILTCQNCSTSFHLDESILKPSGSKVRCSRCKYIWRARPPADEGIIPEDHEADERQAENGVAAAAGLAVGAGAAALWAEGEKTAGQFDAAEAADLSASAPAELKLGLEDLSPAAKTESEENLVTDEIDLGELDLLLDDEPPTSGPEVHDDFQTEELDLDDLEKMLDSEEGEAASLPSALPTSEADELNSIAEESEGSMAEDLDFDMDDLESLLNDDTDLGDGRDLSVQADAAMDAVDGEPSPEMVSELEDLLEDEVQDIDLDETEEIDLSEMEESDPGLSDAAKPVPAFDDDINLELAPGVESLFDESDDQGLPLEATEEIDLAALEGDSESADQAVEEPDVLAIDLDLETDQKTALSSVEEEQTVTTSSDADVEELDLEDFEGLLDANDTDPTQLSPGEEHPELILELEGDTAERAAAEDIDLVLDDLDNAPESLGQGEAESADEDDLGDLDSLLGIEDTPVEKAPESEVEELELELDLGGDADDVEEEQDDATRELNLDDIEKILEPKGADPAGPSAEGADAELDQDLFKSDDPAAIASAAADLVDEGETTDASDALDLSELEKMLEVEDTTDSPALSGNGDADDLDLDFDLQPTADDEDELELEFDLLEDGGQDASSLFDTSESEDLGLDLDIDETTAPENLEVEEDLELEIADAEASSEISPASETAAAGDGEELQNDGAAAAAAAVTMGAAGAAASRDLTQELMDEMAAADTQTMDLSPAESKTAKSAPISEKRKSNKWLFVLLLIILLGAAGYYFYTMTGSDASKFKLSNLPQIPFLSSWLGGKKAPEAVVPIETTLKGSWVQNKTDGRLYIIQGRVKNEYSQPRSYIRVTGRIYADGRKFSRAAHAYCGNMPSREDLENLPTAELQKVLANRNGANDANVMVVPGKEVPFTVIFAGLPEDVELQEYAVEISGSLPVTKAKSQ